MLEISAHIRSDMLDPHEEVPTRNGFGKALLQLGHDDSRVVVLCADLAESTRTLPFKEMFPERYIEVGVAEQNLATIASGLANYGKIPFIASYAAFSPGRNNEQIRTTIALNNVPVKIAGMHAGLSVGPDGATHQALEDIALMRVLPRMTVISPCDAEEARKATIASIAIDGPVYLRFSREKTPLFTTADTPFVPGKAQILWKGASPAVVLCATGPLVYVALQAARELEKEISMCVINVHTIKPLDKEAIVSLAREAGALVTVEEHQVAGGMGSAVAELLAETYPVPINFVGVRDQFGQSGTPSELFQHYGMDVPHIIDAIRRVVRRK